MIARLVQLAFPDDLVHDKALEAIALVALPMVQACPGFVGGYWMTGQQTRAVLITLWRDRASHDAALPAMQRAMVAIAESGAVVEESVPMFETVLAADANGVRATDTLF